MEVKLVFFLFEGEKIKKIRRSKVFLKKKKV